MILSRANACRMRPAPMMAPSADDNAQVKMPTTTSGHQKQMCIMISLSFSSGTRRTDDARRKQMPAYTDAVTWWMEGGGGGGGGDGGDGSGGGGWSAVSHQHAAIHWCSSARVSKVSNQACARTTMAHRLPRGMDFPGLFKSPDMLAPAIMPATAGKKTAKVL